jgi:large subunit ribosomal protein L29
MKIQDLRSKTDAELVFELEKMQKQLFTLRFKAAAETSARPTDIRNLRRDVARVQTLLGERTDRIRGQEPR